MDFRVSSEWSHVGPKGVLVILADPQTPTGAGLPLTGRILFRLATPEGDTEEVQGMNFVCLQTIQCTGVVLRMQAGHSVHELDHLVSCIPARLSNVSGSGDTAIVRVFDDRMRDTVISYLSGQNGVASAATVPIESGTSTWQIVAALPVADHLVRGDSMLRVSAGQPVTITQLTIPGLGIRAAPARVRTARRGQRLASSLRPARSGSR